MTDLLNEVGDAHRNTNKDVDASQDPPLFLGGKIVLTTGFIEDPRGLIKLGVGCPSACALLGVVFNVLDDIAVLLIFEAGCHWLNIVLLRHGRAMSSGVRGLMCRCGE